MSLVRVQTIWSGVGGAPYYTNLYALGPLSTNNGNDLADAWFDFLTSMAGALANALTAQIQPELLEFDETDGTVTGAGSTIQTPVNFTLSGDELPHSQQFLVKWATDGIVHNRRVRGRTFLPGAVEAQNSATGVPDGTTLSGIQSNVDALLTTMSGRMRIWSQPLDQDPADPNNPNRPGSHHEITAATMANYWAILRSRRD